MGAPHIVKQETSNLLDKTMSRALTTDLYHQDTAYVAWRTGRTGTATFDLYIRGAPFGGAYVLVAGLATALSHTTSFRYTEEDLQYLAQLRAYDPDFLAFLRDLRFTGNISAMPEGTVAFPDEPILQVRAPFIEAVLLESGLLQSINLATLIATKASRIVTAAAGRPVSEFALRRAHAPYEVARAASIGGCPTTSNVAAAKRLGLQPTGTIPHALVQLFDTEREAFEAVATTLPQYTLLLDTYDLHQAIHTAVEVARQARQRLGHDLVAVRLDSGDLAADSRYVRGVLDAGGLDSARILASGDLDEFSITKLINTNAPIDGFGVGTNLGIGAGSLEHRVAGGTLGAVYKLAEYEDLAGTASARLKLGGDKSSWPGRKLVSRAGQYAHDIIQLASEAPPPDAAPLLRPVVQSGTLLPESSPPLPEIAAVAAANLRALPKQWRRLTVEHAYRVQFSSGLRALRERLVRALQEGREP